MDGKAGEQQDRGALHSQERLLHTVTNRNIYCDVYAGVQSIHIVFITSDIDFFIGADIPIDAKQWTHCGCG